MIEYVLITGASSGIGYEFAKIFCKNGYGIVLVSSNATRLHAVYQELQSMIKADSMGIKQAETGEKPKVLYEIVKDLSIPGAAEELFEEVCAKQITISILVNNAGVGYAGEFLHADPREQEALMMLNMNNLVILTHCFGQEMCKRGCGRILNVASNGAFQPGPYISTYYASKSFVLNFSKAVRTEFAPYHVTVTTLCPGATISDFARRAGKQQVKGSMTASKVADAGYRGLLKGKNVILPGFHNKAALLVPKKIRSGFIARLYKPKNIF
ncbi:SDR family NAD(P)-dependent oxidoreductase [Anaerosporobacter faecicola]|uniref:SDR family NAD(P)-dependent oxidoreductase n=1 Tax=Anaerosporobacter faecicola TaxID=2718714 RepID=UPI00143AD008|nr:SDR family oxidoreductase [Anaerosporobacter faecicola]